MEAWKPRIDIRDSRSVGAAVDERAEVDRKMDAAVAAYEEAMQRIPQERRGSNDTQRAHTMVRQLTFLRHAKLTQDVAQQTCKTAAAVARGIGAQIDDFINVFASYRTTRSNSGCLVAKEEANTAATADDAGCAEYTRTGNFANASLKALDELISKFESEWTGTRHSGRFFGGSAQQTCTLTDADGREDQAKLPATGVPWAGGLWTLSGDKDDGNKPKITWNGESTETPASDNEPAKKKLAALKEAVKQCQTQAREAEKLCQRTDRTGDTVDRDRRICANATEVYAKHGAKLSDKLHAWANEVLSAVDTNETGNRASSTGTGAQGAPQPAPAPHKEGHDSDSTQDKDTARQHDNKKTQASSVAKGHTLALAHATSMVTAAAFEHQLWQHTPRPN
ncbi:hypothetical protein, conserved (fragment), partial [Trypanosoma vivax Y486]